SGPGDPLWPAPVSLVSGNWKTAPRKHCVPPHKDSDCTISPTTGSRYHRISSALRSTWTRRNGFRPPLNHTLPVGVKAGFGLGQSRMRSLGCGRQLKRLTHLLFRGDLPAERELFLPRYGSRCFVEMTLPALIAGGDHPRFACMLTTSYLLSAA